jgi:HAD superfamily hydrolase (TIGR01509 family)
MTKLVIKAICWDHDGLLVDTEGLFFEATCNAFAQAGALLSAETWSAEYLGKGLGTESIALSLGLTQSQATQAILQRNQDYCSRLESSPPLRSSATEVLAALKGRLPMALVTGSSREQITTVHRRTKLLDCFDCIITREDYEKPKPAPDSYLMAATRLGLQPQSCLAVEDSRRGLLAAVSAGMKCIVVPNSHTIGQDFLSAHACETDLTGVLSYISE